MSVVSVYPPQFTNSFKVRIQDRAKTDWPKVSEGLAREAVYLVTNLGKAFFASLKEASQQRKYAGLVISSAQWMSTFDVAPGRKLAIFSKELAIFKAVAAVFEAGAKVENFWKPWRKHSVRCDSVNQTTGKVLVGNNKPYLRVGEGVVAAPASKHEAGWKWAAQLSDLTFSVGEAVSYGLKSGIFNLAKENATFVVGNIARANIVAGCVMSAQGYWEEGVKWQTGNIVRDEDGLVLKMLPEDKVYSCFKIAMLTAYFAITLLSLATLLGYVIPYALTATLALGCLATVSNILMSIWEKTFIEPLGRKLIPKIPTPPKPAENGAGGASSPSSSQPGVASPLASPPMFAAASAAAASGDAL